ADRVVHARQHILDLLVSPVREDAAPERGATPRAAAVVDGECDVTVSREQLSLEWRSVAFEYQLVLILTIRSTMDPQDGRITVALDEVRRFDHLAVDRSPIAAREGDVLDRTEVELIEQRAIMRAERPQLPGLERIDF